MKRKKGEQRGRRRLSLSWSVCFPLCCLLTAPGAAAGGRRLPISPSRGWALLVPRCFQAGLVPCAVPCAVPPQPLPALPTRSAAFQAEPHGSDSTSSPSPGSLTPCSLCLFMELLPWFCCSQESQNTFNLWSSGCRTALMMSCTWLLAWAGAVLAAGLELGWCC